MSAIRVSAYLPCMPLFGCVCPLAVLGELKKHFKSIIVWLDADKLNNARKIASDANLVGLQGQVFYTPNDPKKYSTNEIQHFLEVLLT
jgi:hypothetical protein